MFPNTDPTGSVGATGPTGATGFTDVLTAVASRTTNDPFNIPSNTNAGLSEIVSYPPGAYSLVNGQIQVANNGVYLIQYSLTISVSSPNRISIGVTVNGTIDDPAIPISRVISTQPGATTTSNNTIIELNAGDLIGIMPINGSIVLHGAGHTATESNVTILISKLL